MRPETKSESSSHDGEVTIRDSAVDDYDVEEDEEFHLRIQGCHPDDENADVLAEAVLVPVPPDGGYGWVIVFCSFMSNMIVDGITYSFGVFFDHIQRSFECTRSETALVGSVLAGFYLMVGPIVGALVNKFGSRAVMITGALIATIGLFVCVFSESVIAMMLLYGVIGGSGFGFIYLPAIVHVGYYFEKKRAIATGISVAGSGMGTFIFAPLAVALLYEYNWRGATWILAGLVLNCAIFGALMRPLKPTLVLPNLIDEPRFSVSPVNRGSLMIRRSGDLTVETSQDGHLPNSASIQQLAEARRRLVYTLSTSKATSQSRLGSICSALDGLEAKGTATKPTPNGTPRTTAPQSTLSARVSHKRSSQSESVAGAQQEFAELLRPNSLGDGTPKHASPEPAALTESEIAASGLRKREPSYSSGLPALPEGRTVLTPSVLNTKDDYDEPVFNADEGHTGTDLSSPTKVASSHALNASGAGSSAALSARSPLLNPQLSVSSAAVSRPVYSRMGSRTSQGPGGGGRISAHSYADSLWRLTSVQSPSCVGSMLSVAPSAIMLNPKEFSRPLYRQDIFYGGSIQNLPEYTASHRNLASYRSRTISVPHGGGFDLEDAEIPLDQIPVREEEESMCAFIPKPMRDTLGEMMDIALLKEPFMILYSLSNIFSMLAFYVPFVYLSNRAVENNVDSTLASFLLSIIGIANTIGRVAFGWLCDRQLVSALTINNWCLLICGVMTVASAWFVSYASMVVYAILFGFFISAHVSLTSIILVDYLGLEKLTNSFGILILFRGAASMAGTPLGGTVYDRTGSYDASFIFAGLLLTLAGAISFLIPLVGRIQLQCRRYLKKAESAVNTNAEPVTISSAAPIKPYPASMSKFATAVELPVVMEDNELTVGATLKSMRPESAKINVKDIFEQQNTSDEKQKNGKVVASVTEETIGESRVESIDKTSAAEEELVDLNKRLLLSAKE